MKNNLSHNKSNWVYKLGFFVILALPILNFNPFFYPPSWTKAIVLKIVITILLSVFLYQILFKYKKLNYGNIKSNPIFWVFSLFFSVFFLSSVFSINPYSSFWSSTERGEGFVNLLFYGLLSLLAFLLVEKETWKKIWVSILGVATFISFLSILSFYGFAPSLLSSLDPRAGATLGNPIPFGIYLLMVLFIAVYLFLSEKPVRAGGDIKKKVFYALSFALLLFSLFLTGSRGAYIGFLAGVFYFLIAYPIRNKQIGKKTITGLRIGVLALLLVVTLTVLYATYTPTAIPLISENRIAKIILPRLSLNFLSQEERFKTWGTVIEVIKEKPILGWGLENMSVGFDKHFDPTKTPLGWWDRSHNTFLDAAVSAGILGLIAYIGLFVVLFWQLHKIKYADGNSDENVNITLKAHSFQAVLTGYAVANIFSIDSFSTLLIFFFLVAYTMHLTNQNLPQNTPQQQKFLQYIQSLSISKKQMLFFIFIILASIFVWQYNIKPFMWNSNLNIARILSENKLCDQALQKIEKINLPQKILGQYGVLEASESLKNCIKQYPGDTIAYSQKELEILEKSLPEYALSGRLWILAGSVASNIAVQEENPDIKKNYLDKSQEYYKKALALSPKSQEIILKMAYIDILKKDCQSATERANLCIDLNSTNGACYWTKASSLICANNFKEAEKNIELAKSFNFNPIYDSSLQQIINAYIAIGNYEKIAEFYEFLVAKNAYDIQYRASLAESYRLSGQYEKARLAAFKIIEVLPGTGLKLEEQQAARKSVKAFLQTLPPEYRSIPLEYQ